MRMGKMGRGREVCDDEMGYLKARVDGQVY